MQRLQAEVDWSAPDLQAQLSAHARRRLVEYVTDYRSRGDSAMVVYDDRGHSVPGSAAFGTLLAESPYVYQHIPSLERYLAAYPHGALPEASEVLFWSEEVVPRLRPILSVTHRVAYTRPELPGLTVIAAKQIYANHYFEAALDLSCVVEREARGGDPPGSYVLVLRRYRFDNMPGGVVNIRGQAVGALRGQLLSDLQRLKESAEAFGR
jgi:hypothetical protein